MSGNDCWNKYVFRLWQKSVKQGGGWLNTKKKAVLWDAYSNRKWTPAEYSWMICRNLHHITVCSEMCSAKRDFSIVTTWNLLIFINAAWCFSPSWVDPSHFPVTASRICNCLPLSHQHIWLQTDFPKKEAKAISVQSQFPILISCAIQLRLNTQHLIR